MTKKDHLKREKKRYFLLFLNINVYATYMYILVPKLFLGCLLYFRSVYEAISYLNYLHLSFLAFWHATLGHEFSYLQLFDYLPASTWNITTDISYQSFRNIEGEKTWNGWGENFSTRVCLTNMCASSVFSLPSGMFLYFNDGDLNGSGISYT